MANPQSWRVQDLTSWLVESALPFWARHGVDHSQGGFYEKLDFEGRAIEEPRRARLVARQIYCFAIGRELGWNGPAAELVGHGLDFLQSRLIAPDGSVSMSSSADGTVRNSGYDPYDYAFVMFALATAARSLADRTSMLALATKVRNRLVANWAHPEIGFEEGTPPRLPLKSNPHMHLLEAFLAWAELVGNVDPTWQTHADAIVSLARTRLISAKTGALTEFFDHQWAPLPDERGLLVEPGHQFEWSWLLARWSAANNDRAAFAKARRLAEIGEVHGIDPVRGVAVNGLDETFKLRDGNAKVWPQTERIKAWHAIAHHPFASEEDRALAHRCLPLAADGLAKFFTASPLGLWREVMRPDGSFVDEPVRASTLYHITCAIHTLNAVVPKQLELT